MKSYGRGRPRSGTCGVDVQRHWSTGLPSHRAANLSRVLCIRDPWLLWPSLFENSAVAFTLWRPRR